KTCSLRIDEYRGDGNAMPVYNEEREDRIVEHQKRIQNDVCNSKRHK
ncbi:unnamed protein product, partial [marine sediment metagenome]